MDNVIQNIKLEDIVPSEFQIDNSQKELRELAISIKNYGILEPLLVRPKNGKYEIILGNKRYEAAKMVGLNTVPVLIKDINDEIFMKYQEINNISRKKDKNQPVSSLKTNNNQEKINIHSPISLEQNQMNFNPDSNTLENFQPAMNYNINDDDKDIVNLSELNKNEYERDDIKMNNGQLNNNGINSTIANQATQTSQSPVEPAFGGRFFPSLEDEPTNMNMGGIINNQAQISPMPVSNDPNGSNSNLIDLTEPEVEKEQPMNSIPNLQNPNFFPQQGPELNQTMSFSNPITPEPNTIMPNMDQSIINTVNMNPNKEMNNLYTQQTPNVVNLESLQNNNQVNSQPIIAPEATPETPSIPSEFPSIEQPQMAPQFDMSQNVSPNPMNTVSEPIAVSPMTQTNILGTPEITPQPITPDLNNIPTMNPVVQNIPEVVQQVAPETQPLPQKDVFPVVNAIKNISSSLEAFGYKLTVTDEDSLNTYKITIEIEK